MWFGYVMLVLVFVLGFIGIVNSAKKNKTHKTNSILSTDPNSEFMQNKAKMEKEGTGWYALEFKYLPELYMGTEIDYDFFEELYKDPSAIEKQVVATVLATKTALPNPLELKQFVATKEVFDNKKVKCICIKCPTPSIVPLCLYIILVKDSGEDRCKYYTVEKSFKNTYVLCSVGANGDHYNYGDIGATKSEVLNKISSFYKIKDEPVEEILDDENEIDQIDEEEYDAKRNGFRFYVFGSMSELSGQLRHKKFTDEHIREGFPWAIKLIDEAYDVIFGENCSGYKKRGKFNLYIGQTLHPINKVLMDLFEILIYGNNSKEENRAESLPTTVVDTLKNKMLTLSSGINGMIDFADMATYYDAMVSDLNNSKQDSVSEIEDA